MRYIMSAINSSNQNFNVTNLGNQLCKPIFNFFVKQLEVRKILKESGITKVNGYSAFEILMYIIILPLISKNIYREFVANKNSHIQKDAIYTFLKNPKYNWDSFLLKLAQRVFFFIDGLTSKKRLTAIVIDDSPLKKNRSTFVELLAKVYDHVSHVYFKGFRFLTIGWTDGDTFIPLQGRCLSSPNERNRYVNVQKSLDPRSNGAKRRKEAQMHTPDVVLRMVKDVIGAGVRATAVVFDSWFTQAPLVSQIAEMIPVIGMTKISKTLCYWYNGKKMCADEIYRTIKSKPRKRTVIASRIVKFGKDIETAITVKLLFIRNRNNGGWLTIISTNTMLSDNEIVKLYSMRWDIETYHHDIKQFLQFEKGCQSTDYDSISAHCTIVQARYIFLAIEKRRNNDPKTLGLLFYSCCDDLKERSFEDAIHILLDKILLVAKEAQNNKNDVVEAIEKACNNIYAEGISSIYHSLILTQICLTGGTSASAVDF